jgi:hypothetical protein
LAFFCLSQISLAGQQSLAEAARREAERRKELERQGVEGKVVLSEAARVAPGCNRGGSAPALVTREGSSRVRSSKGPSLQALRTTLQNLDREIKYGEERLALLRVRIESEKWQLPKVGKISRRSNNTSAQERLRLQMQELEAKLRLWRRERLEAYERGRKAGFLPGELDGKGIVP